ncbi:alpha/beta fold hydrolase [Leucobacter sp. M11]|uniref:alpha/beta fold hydrolase n=1 Tax=Leucobacter sp. M11 TaxID=2993565 RepID=UPI002D811526|nr:alpha/beta fold hydrolase [Leucobacter sp. M11]MEB4615561.1 alpha/beta fold hydrolase [Leucobacter sp. M11]
METTSQTEQLTQRLRAAILSLDIVPGERVTERGLEARFQASRTPARAALLRLESEGLVRRAGRGWQVTPIDLAEIQQLAQYREAVETAAVRIAAAQASQAAIDAVRAPLDSPEPVRSEAEGVRAGGDFHTRVAELSGNPFLAEAVRGALLRLERTRWLEVRTPEARAQAVAEHHALLDAIAARDADLAAELAAKHIRETNERLTRSLTDQHLTLRARGVAVLADPASDARPEEFSFLAGDLARVGGSGPLPEAVRIGLPTPDGEVSALRFGSAAPAVTFLHGAGLNAHTFDPTVLALGLPAVSLDLPGHGRSAWREDADYRPETIAPAVREALAGLRPDGAPLAPQILVGQSLGGLTAALVAQAAPELVRELVIIDITPGVTPDDGGAAITEFITGVPHFASVDEIVDRAIAFGIGHDRVALTRGVTLNTRVRPDGRIEFAHHFAHLSPAAAAEMPADRLAGVWAALEAVRAPITLIRASQGMVSPEQEAQWRERLPHSRVITLEAGHNVQEHAPAALAAVLAELAQAPGNALA